MKTLEKFIERNKGYIKSQTANPALIEKYEKILPAEIVYIWKEFGFGTFENGFMRFVNPDEYAWVLQYCKVYLSPTTVIGVTALGDVLVWEGNDNWTVSADEGNRYSIYFFKKGGKEILGSRPFVIDRTIGDKEFIVKKKYYDSAIFYEAAEKLGELAYDECYGFEPILALGGTESVDTLKKVKTNEYLTIIGETMGTVD